MSTASQPVLCLERVTKVFATAKTAVTVLREVDLVLRTGDFVTVTGPSGAGKTTLLNLAALLDRPTAGRVVFDGQDVSRLDDASLGALRKRRVGMVFQRFCLLSHRTVLENVLFRFRYLDIARAEAVERARTALADMGLAQHADQPARLLSGGEMQRTAIARAIALPPDLLVVDEPTGNLDAVSAGDVMQRFAELNRRGMTLLLATHNTAWLRYGSRHIACHDGTVADAPSGKDLA